MSLSGWIVICPQCEHKADAEDFDPSCADECTCPKCSAHFLFEYPYEEDEEDEE